MAKSNPKRPAVIEMYKLGHGTRAISQALQMSQRTVQEAIKRFKELGNVSDRRGRGRKCTVIVPSVIKKVRERLRRNGNRSMRQMAKEMKIGATSVRTIVKKRLNMKSYRKQQAHSLTERMRKIRVERSKKLLARFRNDTHLHILFSDEKLFSIEPVLNRQNDRVIAGNMKQAVAKGKIVGRSAHPASLMVWGAITSDGKSPLVFVDAGVKINQDVYKKKILEDVLKPWTQSHFGNRRWCFQQDSAPAHKARVVQDWCRRELPDFIAHMDWPSNSPDLNPLDFSVWALIEKKACSIRHPNLDSLKAALIKAWDDLDNNYLRAICDAFKKRLRLCITAKGDNFE